MAGQTYTQYFGPDVDVPSWWDPSQGTRDVYGNPIGSQYGETGIVPGTGFNPYEGWSPAVEANRAKYKLNNTYTNAQGVAPTSLNVDDYLLYPTVKGGEHEAYNRQVYEQMKSQGGFYDPSKAWNETVFWFPKTAQQPTREADNSFATGFSNGPMEALITAAITGALGYGGGSALGLFGGGGAAAGAEAAGAAGLGSEYGSLASLYADGLGGIAPSGFGTTAAGTAAGGGMDWSTLTDFFGEGTDLGGSAVDWGASASTAPDYLQWPSNNIFDAGGGMSIPGVGEVSGVVNLGDAAGIGGMSYAPGGLESLAAGLTGLDTTGTISELIKKYGSKAINALTENGGNNSLVKSLGAAGAGIAGYLGSKSQASDYMKLADRYDAYGAPSRSRYESSFQPGFTMANDPGYTDALNQSSKATLHGLSAQGQGNPADNPNAWAQSLKDNYQQTAYPALQNYRTLNANAGGIASAAPAAIGFQKDAIQSNLAGTQAIGSAANNIFNPPQTTAQQFAQLSQLLGK